MGGAAGIDASFWRAITVFRAASLGYAALLLVLADGHGRPVGTSLVFAAMVAWTAVTAVAYPTGAGWRLLVVDLAVTLGCLLGSWFVLRGTADGAVPVTATWVAGPVLAWAVHGGRRAGVLAALVMAGADIALQDGGTVPLNGAVLLLLAGLAVGHVAQLARRAQERLDQVARREAANRERERLARGIHDSVLQVLALVQRRGAELGGEAAELGRLAGEQERSLRELVRGAPDFVASGGAVDLAAVLGRHAAAGVTVSTAAAPMPVPEHVATEVAAAVSAALDNVSRHAGDGARAWVFAEVDGGTLTVAVRDDGAGFPDGRLREARAEGRLGVAQSIVGRVADLGGTVHVESRPGEGTEIELSVPLQ